MNPFSKPLLIVAACVSSLTFTACGRTETAAETRTDIVEARADGAADVAQERREAVDNSMDAQSDLNKAASEMMQESADGRRAVAVAEAEAVHKVAVEQCDAMTGDMRDACNEKADVDLDQAKKQADNAALEMEQKRQQ